jgi:hypothetical protein
MPGLSCDKIAFIPLAVAGIVLVAYRQMIMIKKMGISHTAFEVINSHWTMHVFGLWVKYNISG